jgi:hypothetical protein
MFSSGRISFADNPWPNGHRLESFAWSGRLFPGRGVTFDFDLRSANYYEDDRDGGVLDEDDELVSAWKSKSAWSNYHSCIMSSVEWGGSDGFLVGTAKKPLDLDALDGAEFRVDELPLSGAPTFATYLLGHDSVADHRIAFKCSGSETTDAYDIDWRGTIALTYAGDTEFRHLFEAAARGVMFDGFRIPKGVDGTTAVRELQRFVVGGEQWVVDRRGAALWLLRPAASVPPKANVSIKPGANANAKTAKKRTAAKKAATKTATKKRSAGRQ